MRWRKKHVDAYARVQALVCYVPIFIFAFSTYLAYRVYEEYILPHATEKSMQQKIYCIFSGRGTIEKKYILSIRQFMHHSRPASKILHYVKIDVQNRVFVRRMYVAVHKTMDTLVHHTILGSRPHPGCHSL